MKEQAGILALNLKKDTPCPVCGSLEHPSPAKRMDNIPTEEELKSIKNIYEKKQDEYNKVLMEMAKVKQSVDVVISDAITPRLKELSNEINCSEIFNENSFEEIKIKGIELSNELKNVKIQREELEKEISKKEKLELRLSDIEKLLNDKEDTLNKLSNEYTNLFGELRVEEETLNNIEKEVPEELRSLNLLNKKIVSLEECLNTLIKSLDYARELKNSLNNKLTSEQSKIKELGKSIDELTNDIKDIKTSIDTKLKELNFIDYEEYEDSKKYISLIDSYTLEINSYKEDIKSLKDREKDLIKKTENLNVVNLEELDCEINNKQVNLKEIDKNIKEVYSLINNNSAILKEIKNVEKLISYKEEEYKVIGELSNLANGKKSPYITFERFVLASYFQEIIDSANIRLSKMTNDRFILKRKEDKGKGTSQQGLELEVYDNYTGKSRHVKTLSGGESFKASLSLALGLSDVVQANAGGISLDTMFIDEGFGTLDPESLENAINTLLELQRSGRLVGIISHVPELRERIEAQLEISVSAEGSSTKFNIN
nr:SbcC/MukB-like Walker B domain-containing protein [Clostridium paraputrificum]